MAQIVLNLSKYASSIGVLAEIGWIGDEGEAEIQMVRQARALKNTPCHSLAHSYFNAMIDRNSESQFISTLDLLQNKYKTEFKFGTNQMTKEAVFAITKKIQTTARIALAEKI